MDTILQFIKDQLKANPSRVVGYFSTLAVAGAIQLAKQFGVELDSEAQAAVSVLSGLVITELIRRFVFSPKTTQAIADRAAATGDTDIENPPSGA